MTEDVLEQLVEGYLQQKGYFTRHNVKFRPAEGPGYDAKQDSVHSDIDVIGIHPRLRGPNRVWAVSCKSWQGGFRPQKWIEDISGGKRIYKRDAWRYFRELAHPKWSKAFLGKVEETTGSSKFTHVTAVTKLIGDRTSWENHEPFSKNLGGNPVKIITFSEMLDDLLASINTTPMPSELGRLLQLIKASGWLEQAKER